MASAQDVLNAVNGANGRLDEVNNRLGGVHTRLDGTNARLDDVKAKLDQVTKSIQDVNTTLNWGFAQLITIGNYTNQALAENAAQNDTMICILEHISKNTCELVNQSVIQTRLQTEMEKDIDALEAIEECCPPQVAPPPCAYQACPAPRPLGEPPRVDPQQRRG